MATVLVVLGVQVAARRAAGGAADRQAGTRQADSLIETIVRLYICARRAVICFGKLTLSMSSFQFGDLYALTTLGPLAEVLIDFNLKAPALFLPHSRFHESMCQDSSTTARDKAVYCTSKYRLKISAHTWRHTNRSGASPSPPRAHRHSAAWQGRTGA